MEWLYQMNLAETIVNGILVLMIGALWKYLSQFVKEQRDANRRNSMSIRSMQRSELTRYFRMVVEDGKPISVEEMTHIEACYKAYHANGGNGAGTLMYERIKEHACIVTKIEEPVKIGGSE